MPPYVHVDATIYLFINVLDTYLRKDPSIIGFSFEASFQPGRSPYIIIVTEPPTVPGQDLNSGALSLEESPHIIIIVTRPPIVLAGI